MEGGTKKIERKTCNQGAARVYVDTSALRILAARRRARGMARLSSARLGSARLGVISPGRAFTSPSNWMLVNRASRSQQSMRDM